MNVGDTIDGYTVLSYLDSGGMGSVYVVCKGKDCYALKICNEKDSESIKRFKREVRLMESVRNPHVIEVIDKNLDIDEPYFVMPFCTGSLSDFANVNDDTKFDYAKQFCMGIKALHDLGIIHRDIKPSNALIFYDQVKVSDLGLGKFVKRDSTIITPTDASLGTPGYMSPEVYKDGDGRNADKRSDIYSIGMLLYYLFSGGEDIYKVDESKVSADIYSIINKCIKISPNDRYQDVSDIIDVLDVCQKARTSVLSIVDIISAHKVGVNDAKFADDIYNHLLSNQSDLGLLINDLRFLKQEGFRSMLRYRATDVDNLIHLLLITYRTNTYYWLQFEDVDILVDRARLLMQVTNLLQEKQDLLDFAIQISIEYTRWPSMRIVVDMLHDLAVDEVRASASFFTAKRDDLNLLKDIISEPLPESVQLLIC